MKLFKKKEAKKKVGINRKKYLAKIYSIKTGKKDALKKFKKVLFQFVKEKYKFDLCKKTYEELIFVNNGKKDKKRKELTKILETLIEVDYADKEIQKQDLENLIEKLKKII